MQADEYRCDEKGRFYETLKQKTTTEIWMTLFYRDAPGFSMLMIPVNFPSAANAVEGATIVNEFTDDFTADLSEPRITSMWAQGYTWKQNTHSATV